MQRFEKGACFSVVRMNSGEELREAQSHAPVAGGSIDGRQAEQEHAAQNRVVAAATSVRAQAARVL